VIGLPTGRTSLHDRHRSPASGVIARTPDGAVVGVDARFSSAGISTLALGRRPDDAGRVSAEGSGGAGGGGGAADGSGTATGRSGVVGSSGPASRLRSELGESATIAGANC
jgi:hypothetical protein